MRKSMRLASWSNNQGLTFVELLVTMVILSILAGLALPYAELTLRREKELELRSSLREIRTALDQFHSDWNNGLISKTGNGVSEDGFPKTLTLLVEGVEAGDAKGTKRRYLRRVPRDPFSVAAKPSSEQWVLRGYQDELGSSNWGGKDIYDVRSASNAEALDGTHYKDW